MEPSLKCIVRIATSDDKKYIPDIISELNYSATQRGTGIPHRKKEYLAQKIEDGLAIIAINRKNKEWAGFCYLEVWQHQKYVANSGLIIAPKYRGMGLAKTIKTELFEWCKTKFLHARIFSLTTNPAVMHVNAELGYKVVPHSGIIRDKLFMEGCDSWVNYLDLMNNSTTHSNYVAMVFDPIETMEKEI